MKSKNWYDNNPFFENKHGYDEFVKAMMMAADCGNLPLALQHEEPEALTMDDIKSFSRQFKQDSGLDIEFRLMTCSHCNRLHCIMIVDELSEEEANGNDWN